MYHSDAVWQDIVLIGGEGNDVLTAGDGNDQLIGGSGADSLDGGPGDDTLRGQDGDDQLVGGDDQDRILADYWMRDDRRRPLGVRSQPAGDQLRPAPRAAAVV